MSAINILKKYAVYFALFSYTYLTFCPLWFEKQIYTIIINQLPFLFLFFIDICIFWSMRKKLFTLINFYMSKNKLLFIGIIIFVLYDLLTLLWSNNWNYSLMKYLIFIKTAFLGLSTFLCVYEEDYVVFKKNVKWLIKSFGWTFIIAVVTTIIRWICGISPYWRRVSLTVDYNTFASYLLFLLIISSYYFYKFCDQFSIKMKVLYIIFAIIGCDLIYLSGSRRAVILLPLSIAIYWLMIFVHNKFSNHIEKKSRPYITNLVKPLMILIILLVNLYFSVPVFEQYISHLNLKQTSMRTSGVYEGGLSSRYDTITGKEGLVSRKDIWQVAINEIKYYNTQEIIRGKGNGYAWEIYENSQNRDVRLLLDAYNMKKPSPKWMSPHSFVFKEFLEGGIIKIALVIYLCLVLLWYIVVFMKKEWIFGMMIFNLFVCIWAEWILGSTYGLLGEDLFWLVFVLFILLKSVKISREVCIE